MTTLAPAARLSKRHIVRLGTLAGLALAVLPAYAQTRQVQKAEDVRLTLSSQTAWQGEFFWCTLSAEIAHGQGGIAYRCGGAGPFGTASPGVGASAVRRRVLTDSETATLRKLYDEARLFDGGHVGKDYSGSDWPFYILMARSMTPQNQAVVLVTTGNPTFAGGPRGALFAWLIGEQAKLLR